MIICASPPTHQFIYDALRYTTSVDGPVAVSIEQGRQTALVDLMVSIINVDSLEEIAYISGTGSSLKKTIQVELLAGDSIAINVTGALGVPFRIRVDSRARQVS